MWFGGEGRNRRSRNAVTKLRLRSLSIGRPVSSSVTAIRQSERFYSSSLRETVCSQPNGSAEIRGALAAKMAGQARWPISEPMLDIATIPARKLVIEVEDAKMSLQIASICAGLNGTIPALWLPPITTKNVRLKSPAIAIPGFDFSKYWKTHHATKRCLMER